MSGIGFMAPAGALALSILATSAIAAALNLAPFRSAGSPERTLFLLPQGEKGSGPLPTPFFEPKGVRLRADGSLAAFAVIIASRAKKKP